MLGSLCLRRGVLYVGRHARTAEVRLFDLEGRALGGGFRFRGLGGGRAEASGLAVDADRRIWVADRAGGAVRAFTAFGRELEGLRPSSPPDADRPGSLGDAVAVAADGVEDDLRLLVARGGHRRHALQFFDPRRGSVLSLLPRGERDGEFRGLAGVALLGNRAWACEADAGCAQVFRDGEFLFAFGAGAPSRPGARFRPRAIAALSDGRALVAQDDEDSSALLLFDAGGRLLRVVADHGAGEGSVLEPCSVAVEEGENDASTRAAVLDLGAGRVQIFRLDGTCVSRFGDLDVPGQAAGPGRGTAPPGTDFQVEDRPGQVRGRASPGVAARPTGPPRTLG